MSNERYTTDEDLIAKFKRLTAERDPAEAFCGRGEQSLSVSDIIREMRDSHSSLGAEILETLRDINSVNPRDGTLSADE